ncbi:MAG TPA: ABC transporter ATP-binding protein [Pseudomonadales bacterium]|nr:ABC transporter ATP-binding protein [Pseudomonadales bacterium]
MSELMPWIWPLERLQDAVETLAQRAGLQPRKAGPSTSAGPAAEASLEQIGQWLEWACGRLGVESEAVEASWEALPAMLRGAAPALLRLTLAQRSGVLLIERAGRRGVTLLGPDLRSHRCGYGELLQVLGGDAAAAVRQEIEAMLAPAQLPAAQHARVANQLLQQRLGANRFEGCWMLRMPPSAPFLSQLRLAGLPQRLVLILLVILGLYGLEAAGWTLIGRGALAGNFDAGWLLAWLLVLLSMVPLHLLAMGLQGRLAIQTGTLLKQRLLHGALSMNLDQIRQHGSGKLLGWVIESQAFDSLLLSGGLGALFALVEMALAGWILSLGPGGLYHTGLLALWLVITLALCWRYYGRLRQWTQQRFGLTDDLVERMVGHRTRLAQEPAAWRHRDEDQQLAQFLLRSRQFDHALVPMAGGLPRGWLVLGLLGLAPGFMLGAADSGLLAVGLGGVLLAYRAFGETAAGLVALTRAAVAWEQIAPLFRAQALSAPAALPPQTQGARQTGVLMQARDLTFRFQPNAGAVLQHCDLRLNQGDKILLQGPSGSGKSTLAAVLTGLRQAESGVLLLEGLDPASWGGQWRKLSTGAPQFHQNHILSGTLAFNLLMGRVWPPSDADLAEAESLCHELGLSDLLSRMPAGLLQIVGETGWQLSHGERSRIYLARALLQRAKLVVLDESFAALDPATLQQCLRCAMTRAPSLLVIAHP